MVWSIEDANHAKARLIAAIDQQGYGLQIFLKARVKKIGNQGWLRLNTDDEVEEQLRLQTLEDVQAKLHGDLVKFVDDAWVEGAVSVTRRDDEGDLDDKIFSPMFLPDIPAFDGSEYQANSIQLKASRLTSPLANGDFIAYGGASSRIYIRKKYFSFDTKERTVTIPNSPIISIGDECSFVRFEGFYFIFNEKRFEQLSGHSEMVLTRARAAVEALMAVEGVSFSNLEEVDAALSNTEFARKLAAAHSQGIFDDLSAEALNADIAQNEINLDFAIDGDNLVLTPDLSTRIKRREFVDLLVESLFVSRSGRKFRALQKLPRS